MIFKRRPNEVVQMFRNGNAFVISMHNGMEQRLHKVEFQSPEQANEYLAACCLEILLWGFQEQTFPAHPE